MGILNLESEDQIGSENCPINEKSVKTGNQLNTVT